MAKTDPAAGHRGISAFLVDAGTPGLAVGKREHKLGMESSSTVSLAFTKCRVPAAALLGELGQGFRIALTALDSGRVGIASQALGIATLTLRSPSWRPAGARERQDAQFRLADRRRARRRRAMIERAARLKDEGRPIRWRPPSPNTSPPGRPPPSPPGGLASA
jgi:alkylation response protein AidB-like acyl-CoA dehydrogenase